MKKLFLSMREPMASKAFFAAMLMMLAAPHDAQAQSAESLGGLMCSVSFNLIPFQDLFVGLSYIMGAILIGVGLYQVSYLADTLNASRQYGISRPKGYMIAGACLLALPAFINWMIHSLYGFGAGHDLGNGLMGCIPEIGAGGSPGSVGLDGLMINLIENIKSPMTYMLSIIAILVGIFMVIRGLLKGAKFGQDAKSSLPNIFANIIIGTILFTVGTSLHMIMATVFGDSGVWGSSDVTSAIAYDFGADTVPFQQAVYAALTFFQLVGFIAFIRGWIILRDAVEGQGQKTVPQGLTHIIGGVLAVNIYRFLEVMDTSFGTGFL